MKAKTLSLCMIVKNEEKYISNCLQSVEDIVDEKIIVDTGSTDSTPHIAQSLGAKVYHFPWNHDFSAARNYSLEQSSGEWILILDADEELHPEDQTKLKELIKYGEADAYALKIHSYINSHQEREILVDARVSLFRNNKKFRYKGAIHEEIESSIREQGDHGKMISSDIRIIHYGYLNNVLESKNKGQRNKEIILRQLNKEKDNVFLRYALATEYLQEKDYKTAIILLHSVIEKWDPDHPNFSDALYKLALSYKERKEYTACKKWLIQGIELFPNYTDLYYLKGTIELEAKEWKQAEASFLTCISIGSPSDKFYTLEGVGSFRAWYALGILYEITNQREKAIAAYLQSLQINAQFRDAFSRLIQYILKEMNKNQFLEFLQKQFDINHPETFYSIGQSLIRRNRFDYLLYLVHHTKVFDRDEKNYVYFLQLCENMSKKIYHEQNH